jgi:hypothetical protein
VTNRCPFCGNYAYASSVGDAYQMDCRYCDIQVEITKRAYAAKCPDPVGVLEYIQAKMKSSTRPRVDLVDMKRTRQPLALRQEEEITMSKQTRADTSEPDGSVLSSAAKAIGATLGMIAVKTGIAKPSAEIEAVPKKAASKKKTPGAKKAAGAKTQIVSKNLVSKKLASKKIASKKESPKKSTPPAKTSKVRARR